MKLILAIAMLFTAFTAFAEQRTVCFRNDGHYIAHARFVLRKLDPHIGVEVVDHRSLPIAQERCYSWENTTHFVQISSYMEGFGDPRLCNYYNVGDANVRFMAKGDIFRQWCEVERM